MLRSSSLIAGFDGSKRAAQSKPAKVSKGLLIGSALGLMLSVAGTARAADIFVDVLTSSQFNTPFVDLGERDGHFQVILDEADIALGDPTFQFDDIFAFDLEDVGDGGLGDGKIAAPSVLEYEHVITNFTPEMAYLYVLATDDAIFDRRESLTISLEDGSILDSGNVGFSLFDGGVEVSLLNDDVLGVEVKATRGDLVVLGSKLIVKGTVTAAADPPTGVVIPEPSGAMLLPIGLAVTGMARRARRLGRL